MRFKELLRPAEQVSPIATIKDRRRPGRNDQVSSHLIPLLRNPARMDIRAPVPDKLEMPLVPRHSRFDWLGISRTERGQVGIGYLDGDAPGRTGLA